MNKISKLKKLLIPLIILLIGILIKISSTQAVITGLTDHAGRTLSLSALSGTGLYCINVERHFYSGTYVWFAEEQYSSDSANAFERQIAYVLYQGAVTGQGGNGYDSSVPSYSNYQEFVWMWKNGRHSNTFYKNSINAVNYANFMADVAAHTANPTSSAAGVTITSFKMNGEKGEVKLANLSGNVTSVEVKWKDVDKTQTISEENSEVKDWIQLYSDSDCTKQLKAKDIRGDFYLKNLKPDNRIESITFNISSGSDVGYKVNTLYYQRSESPAISQRVMEVIPSPGEPTKISKKVDAEYTYGKIKIVKKGVYKKNGTEKKQNISATFKLYCSTTKKWVSGKASDEKKYVDNINNATEYTSGTTIENLYASYQYELVEVKVDNKYYNNPIKMVLVTSNKQDNLVVSHNGIYYSAPGITVYQNQTNTVTVTNERTSGDLTIIKKDNKNNKTLDGAEFRLYLDRDSEDGTKGWVISSNGKGNGEMSYKTTAGTDFKTEKGQIKVENLKYGVYKIYETKSPDDQIYELDEQEGYEGDDVSKTNHWVYCGEMKLDENKKITRINDKSLRDLLIKKTDNKENKPLAGAKFRLYLASGAKDGTTGWVTSSDGTATGDKQYGATAGTDFVTGEDGKILIRNLKFGNYKVYETESSNPYLYQLSKQPGYESDDISKANHWVYFGNDKQVKLADEGDGKDTVFEYSQVNKRTVGDLIITKTDDDYKDLKLEGAEFRLYSVEYGAWVTASTEAPKIAPHEGAFEYNKATTAENAAVFKTNAEGIAEIKNLSLGKYRVYESKAPKGYDITKQNGYETDDVSKTNHWVFIQEVEVQENDTKRNEAKYSFKNKKIISLEGKVWEDIPQTKDNKNNHMYDDGEQLLDGINVYLCKGSDDNYISQTVTSNGGHYKFENLNYWDVANCYIMFAYDNKTYINVNPFTGENKVSSKAQEYTITAEKLDDRNLTGTDGANPGRAVTYKDKTNQMNDFNEILKNTNILTAYYNDGTYTIEDINLGLMKKKDPNYSIKEELAYIKVRLNGYTYTYKYGEGTATDNSNSVIESLYVPTTSMQTLTGGYTAQIYPSDVAYNAANGGDKLKLYVVYRITVSNDETENVNDKYVEQKLYLTSLNNSFDIDRYTLATDENLNDEHGSDFKLWSTPETRTNEQGKNYGVTSYDVNNESSVYKNGIEKNSGEGMDNNAVSSYIQFRMKDNALKAILDGNYNEYHEEIVPTQTTADAYHDYLRTDNIWDKNTEIASWRGNSSIENGYSLTSPSDKKAFVHRSVDKQAKSYALYVHMKLGSSRTISGTVFEDTATRELNNNGKTSNVGDGTFNNNENIARKVKVELLNATAKSTKDYATVADLTSQDADIADLYVKDDSNSNHYSILKAQTETKEDGTYSFAGVIPGVYYIRFTYGDGTQKIFTTDGAEVNDIKVNEYTSTTINDQIVNLVKAANDLSDAEINEIIATILNENASDTEKEAAKKKVEWYKYIQDNSAVYSTSTDDLGLRSEFDDRKYSDDGKVYDKNGNEIAKDVLEKETMKAFTPITSISIENDPSDYTQVSTTDAVDAHKNEYTRFNLGIIKTPETIITLNKRISHIDVTSQQGSTIISEQPKNSKAVYLSDLDKKTEDGSKYAKLEINPELVYGSNLKVTYKLTVTNASANDYIEHDGVGLGNYRNYGIFGANTELKHVSIEEVDDLIDEKYRYSENQVITTEKTGKTITVQLQRKVDPNEDITANTKQYLKMTGFNEVVIGESETISYEVTAPVNSSEDDLLYNNDAQVKQIRLDNLTTLQSSFDWDKAKDTTIFTITPPTGENRENSYWVMVAIVLTVLASGIVFIRKKDN